jgi:hypothetical protein
MTSLYEWAVRHGVSQPALQELMNIFVASTPDPQPQPEQPFSEAAVQNLVRLEASRLGMRIWRNNVGACMSDEGQMVRYGLANDSKTVNAVIKSSDLIGIKPVTVQPHHVGTVIGQFIAREVKHGSWVYRGSDHERAQKKFMELVVGLGGDACFATGEGTLHG